MLHLFLTSIFKFLPHILFSGSSKSESGSGKVETQSDSSRRTPSTVEEIDPASRPTSSSGGADGELVLNPLRLAFETKNIKVVELALDCLHVGYSF